MRLADASGCLFAAVGAGCVPNTSELPPDPVRLSPSSHPHWTRHMIRFKANAPAEKPAPASAAKTEKPASKAKASKAAPKEDLLDLGQDTPDDKD